MVNISSSWLAAVVSVSVLSATGNAAAVQHVFSNHYKWPSYSSPSSLEPSKQWRKVTTMDAYPNHQLRVKSPQLCDPDVKQYSGYLDTAEDKHFFFWFFEARNPKPTGDTPIILWTNGGPGCSSMTGLLMELGPCRVNKGGNGTVYNPYSWNTNAHVLFIDQPLNTGFSHGKWIDDSMDAGKDVDTFLRMFYHSFPEYANSDLHLFGESYAGHTVPAMGKAIQDHNRKLLRKRQMGELSMAERQLSILHLASIGIGNGLVDAITQNKYYSKMACNSTYPPVLDQAACDKIDAAVPTCNWLGKACYKWQSRLACAPAQAYCVTKVLGPFIESNTNPYDVRQRCKDRDHCYEIDKDIVTYLNRPEVQQELGVDVKEFKSCDQKVYFKFMLRGDWMRPFHRLVPPILEDGIRVLIYAGDADWICNWYGSKAWTMELEWEGKQAFNDAGDRSWDLKGEPAGEVRSHGNFTFVRVFGAGHMAPYDRPRSTLDMVNRWVDGISFSSHD